MLPKKILVVEDNEINRAMLREILSPQYQVLEAENGQVALEVLKQYREEISLILLDIVMPVMDGYTFLSKVKENRAYSSIPVIVTTQSEGESDEVTALSHGATDFVAKPYKPQVILHRVASIIHLRETAAMINLFQYDRLTGVYTKEFFYQRVREILRQEPKKDYDIICSDIENFKLVNDVFGIPAGDKLLKEIAKRYLQLIGGRGICGRFNADQFICLIEHLPEYKDEWFVQATAEVGALANNSNIVMKWGIYHIDSRSISVEQMCDRALLAVRSIKGQYGKYFATYDDELRDKLLREQMITDSMEPALAQGQFEIYLQPKYQIKDNKLAGAEALVRWNHPQWGLWSPAEFIPLFEKSGFITKLDQYVWEKTCALLHSWDQKGYPNIPVSVNVSRADIYNVDLADFLMKMIRKYELKPSCLHLEITESAYTEDPNQIIATVGNLRELGFDIEMDDFGSGYSSLNMLNKMPVDVLKLDMRFIQSETAKPVNQGILRFIMGLARWMGLQVVAEGVETGEQLERLRESGCDFVQGYYFAKPMPCECFEELLRKYSESLDPEVVQEPADEEDNQKKVMLIADEDEDYRREVRKTFEERYRIVEATSGQEALNYAAKDQYKIAVMLLSMTLRHPDGNSVLEGLQKEKAVWGIPVIATAPCDPQLEAKALELGADDFAGKPHLQQSLWKRVLRAEEISAARHRELLLQDAAYRDYLTGLLNRRGLDAMVATLSKKEAPLVVYLFDLDNLKKINDTYGHMKGDRLLMEFGTFLRSHARETDIVCRFGGDEFIFIMRQVNSTEAALKKGKELCEKVRQIRCTEEFPVACSAGMALWNLEEPLQKVIAQADRALYFAKKENKGSCCLWRG